MSKRLKDLLVEIVEEGIVETGLSKNKIHVYLENQKEHKFGDWAINVAMKLAKECRRPPLEIAKVITEYINQALIKHNMASFIEKIEIKPPGFINIFVANNAFAEVLKDVRHQLERFGSSEAGGGEKVLIEFVSANPTGSLSIAHARQAAVGDTIAKIMKFAGYDVTKEYYLNDEGNQIGMLGKSLGIRYLEAKGETTVAFPEDGYHGEYLKDYAQELISSSSHEILATVDSKSLDDNKVIQFFSDYAVGKILKEIKDQLDCFDVTFDNWFSQKTLKKEKIEELINQLRQKGYVYDQDGATWFKSTEFGDDKDRVLIKSDGEMTYLTPDILYHKLKFERGFDRLVNIWGPDHHGYINRLKAAACALGYRKENVDILERVSRLRCLPEPESI